MKSNLKFGIIGCGRIAQRHAEQIQKIGTLAAVCDTIAKASQSLADQYQAKSYTDIESLLAGEKDIDVVSICSPNGLHAEHSIKALKAGVHVLCEKPMAISVYDCGRMIDAAEKANKRLFIVKQNRYNPPVVAVKNLVESGALGTLYSVQLNCFWNRNNEYYKGSDWKGTKKLDGGTLYTQFSHFIDLLYWIVGDVKNIKGAMVSNKFHKGLIEIEDTGCGTLEFHNGTIGTLNYSVNAYKKNMEGSLTIFAEKGTIKIGGQYLNELDYQAIEGAEIKDLPQGNPPNNYGQYLGSMSNHDKVYQNVVDVLTKQGVIGTNGFEGLKTVEIIDKFYSSAAWI
jgi:UDP-N-acetyl-2-amino-2-deoxyglucuronate dehydrogenase